MNIKNFTLATVSTLAIAILTSHPAQAQKFVDIIGNPPYGADPVNGVIGSGATPNTSTRPTFANGSQGKVNALSATLTPASISGSQTVGGNTVNVDPAAAETALTVINSPIDANLPARDALVVALGGGEPAQQLARSMQGIRSGDGSIDPTLLTGAVNSYNSYIKSLIASSQATQKPASELDSFVQTLPPGQKAAQVVLAKLLEAAR
jgi:pterin-4a-carbinolamine dehydratase